MRPSSHSKPQLPLVTPTRSSHSSSRAKAVHSATPILPSYNYYGNLVHKASECNIPSKDIFCDYYGKCRNPSFGLATKAKGVTRVRAKGKPKSHIKDSRECRKVWGSEPSHSQGNSHFGRWSPSGLPKLQRPIWWVKSQWLVALFISLESSWSVDV